MTVPVAYSAAHGAIVRGGRFAGVAAVVSMAGLLDDATGMMLAGGSRGAMMLAGAVDSVAASMSTYPVQEARMAGAVDAVSGSMSAGPNVPSWVASTASGTWVNVGTATGMAKLSTLDPKDNSDINPNYPLSPEWQGSGGQKVVFRAWNGACYDEENDVLWCPLQGGHGDYGGNEPYKIALNASVPQWVMVRPPSGAKGNLLTTNDGNEASGVYADGQPRSIHSGNKPVFVPGDGPWIGITGPTSYAGNAGLKAALRIDPVSGLGTYGSVIPAGVAPGIDQISLGGVCHDTTRGCIWFRPPATGYMFKYTIATDTWVRQSASKALSGTVGMVHVAAKDLIVMTCSLGLVVYDPVADTYTTITPTGSTTGAPIYSDAQIRWTGTDFAWWDNSTNTTIISKLTPPAGDWKTGAWTLGEYTVSGSNTVTPPARLLRGTFGRFAYSPNFKGFILMGEANDDIYFFKL